jgi:cytochrome c oxidase subunit 2
LNALGASLAAFGAMLTATGASAEQPVPWGLTFQPPATDLAAQNAWFEQYTLLIITAITLFVLALLVVVIVRFNARRNPEPSQTSHNTLIEVIWTIVPVLILVMIAFPSFRLLYNYTTIPEPDLTIKAIGAQWYWNYEYMDEEYQAIQMTSLMLEDDQRTEWMERYGLDEHDVPRLLAVNYPIAVPVGKVVHLLANSNDVNHAWTIPAFGVKTDAIQGRLNERWFEVERPGVYYGQCSELCGRNHAFMPIEVHALTEERFNEWAELATTDMDAARDLLMRWKAEDSDAAPAVAQLAD